MNKLIFIEAEYSSLLARLQSSKLESCAILLTNVIQYGHHNRLLVRDMYFPPLEAYRKRNTSRAVLAPEFLVPIVKKALKAGNGLVFVHTHPWEEGTPKFSIIDDDGERALSEFLKGRNLGGPHVALVSGANSCRARVLGANEELAVVTVGTSLRTMFEPSAQQIPEEHQDRQVRLLGRKGQDRLSRIEVGVVGLGGTGSVVVQQLAYLGVQRFLLIDPDFIDETNLNRLVGAHRGHVGSSKVSVASEHIMQINPKAKVIALRKNILEAETVRSLLNTDFIFSCTDSQASRAVLNQFAYQYLVPTIDTGVSITTADQKVARISGRVQLLSPSQACLTCQELLDANVVRQEFMTPQQRAQDPYFIGNGEPQPAVISLNSTMSSLAVTMLLAVVADLPSRPRHLLYDALQGKVRPATASQCLTCVVCSRYGALGRGEEWPLPVRQGSTNESSQ